MNRDRKRGRRNRAFTIMELLIVMAIMTIISGMAMMAYLQMRPQVVLRGTAKEVASEIQKARMLAIQKGRNVRMLIQKQTGGTSSNYNPTGVTYEWLVTRVIESAGVEREISSYQIPKGYPPVYFWGHAEATVGGASSNTFIDGDLEITPGGFLEDSSDAGKAFRLSTPRSEGQRNILEVAVPTASVGSPRVAKYLLPGDRPASAAAQNYFVETVAQLSTTKNLWVWY